MSRIMIHDHSWCYFLLVNKKSSKQIWWFIFIPSCNIFIFNIVTDLPNHLSRSTNINTKISDHPLSLLFGMGSSEIAHLDFFFPIIYGAFGRIMMKTTMGKSWQISEKQILQVRSSPDFKFEIGIVKIPISWKEQWKNKEKQWKGKGEQHK